MLNSLSFNQSIPLKNKFSIHLDLKRLDLIHPTISGNKFFKLYYNLQHAKQLGFQSILSFGGAYSNHVLALAYACNQLNLKSVAMIRGHELKDQPLNPVLTLAKQQGMQFCFVSREEYRLRHELSYLEQLKQNYPHHYIIPEGGTNALAIQGCMEILSEKDKQYYDIICCAVGTGGTMTGLIESSLPQHTVLGFSALKGAFLNQTIQNMTNKTNWQITEHYCMGGYAKLSMELWEFLKSFEQQYAIVLDPIYTGKMMYGVIDLIHQGYFPPHSRILAIHSGGQLAGQQRLHHYLQKNESLKNRFLG